MAGRWHVRRRIRDARAGGTAQMEGEARFLPDAEGLRYEETGTLTLPGGQRLASGQVYLWRFDPLPRVLFADGRLFHLLDPSRLRTVIRHLCGEDLYTGRYRMHPARWEMLWHVRGPRKDQLSRIAYRRR
nr:DUF6314 family protein [Mangrovicoccus algicola]